MTWLSDSAVAHLRAVAELPDFSNTRYRIEREIARGGMGVVYEAEDVELHRRVAIKVLASELASEHAVERMRAEARTIAKLEHPGIVPLHDVGLLPDGRLWYAMKLVRGRRLDELNASVADLLRVFLRICEAVSFAHANGIIHCDLKPENVMLGDFGEVLVMDWGVARQTGASDALIAGTRGFMSPEQEQGAAIDASTDVFALGAMLCAILPSNVPRPLAAICTKASSPEKANRYASVRDMANDIANWLDGQPIAAYRENIAERAGRWLSRNRALVTIVLAYLVMRIIVILWVHR
ncbi:MAG: eukaryotic-like serine/threonine-protein kinase [Thermoanaerobaculia bacterium]|jgi:serine/threonine-protein kinase|nr:eukaryotic-like serine/threonine-protein kinase [Thermoanaerobaculia bacterium]